MKFEKFKYNGFRDNYNECPQYEVGDRTVVEINESEYECFIEGEERVALILVYGGKLFLIVDHEVVLSVPVKGWRKMSHHDKANTFAYALSFGMDDII